MKRTVMLVVLLGVGLATLGLAGPLSPAPDDTEAERAAIKAAALDYVDGYYTGSGERMERALHEKLSKRIARVDQQTGKPTLQEMTAEQLIKLAASGAGLRTPTDEQRRDIKILDVFENVASVRADMHGWIDYMHLAKIEGQWKIINVLWETRPEDE